MALIDVTQISLDTSDMFIHIIELRKEDGSLELNLRVLPSESKEKFHQIVKRWNEVRGKK